MIRHFTYEIDERNLRVKLKDLELPLKDGAWESFDDFSTVQSRDDANNKIRLKFSLNRNVVVLAIFGAVIISFSLLLFNFISIKNPKKETVQSLNENKAMAEKTVETPPKPQPVAIKAVPVPTVEAVKDTVVVKTEIPVAAKEKAAEPVPVPEKKVEKQVDVEELSGEEIEAREKKAEETRLKKEKQKEQRAAAAMAKRIKPSVITEDTEPDVRPD